MKRYIFLFSVILLSLFSFLTIKFLYHSYSPIGKASWYGADFHGRPTASGEVYDMQELTAAHRRLPFGTKVKVTNLQNGKSVIVKINDRGPYKLGRIIDLSYAAAARLKMIKKGVVLVKMKVLSR